MILFNLFSNKNWYIDYVKFLIEKENEKIQEIEKNFLYKMHLSFKDKHNLDVSNIDNFWLDYNKK